MRVSSVIARPAARRQPLPTGARVAGHAGGILVGLIGVLALSGSQGWGLGVLRQAPAEPSTLTLVGPTSSATPEAVEPGPTLPPTVPNTPPPTIAPTPARRGPYGLSGTAALTTSGIPQPAMLAYRRAAASLARSDPGCGLTWSVLAGIGRVESDHGRFSGSSIGADGVVRPPILGIRLDGSRPGTSRISDSDGGRWDGDRSVDRAVGPMQFLPGTWRAYGGGADPQDLNAAALAAGRYLCAGDSSLRTPAGAWAAVYRYNHSDSYVSLVLSLAAGYAAGGPAAFPDRPAGARTDDGDQPATAAGRPPSLPETPAAPKRPSPATSPPTTSPKPTPSLTPSPTPTPTPSPTPSPTASPTASPTPSPTPSPTSSPTPSPTPSPTGTPTPTANRK